MAYKKEEVLSRILIGKFGPGSIIKPSYVDFRNSILHEEIETIYKKLNGQLKSYPSAFRNFDIGLVDCVVELDEEQHFNNYRNITLTSSIYNSFKTFVVSDYKEYCKQFESECLKKGNNRKYWRTDSSDKQFGKSAPEGILTGNGSSRWRQRAFYDFLKDAGQQILNYKLVRISIYHKIEKKFVGEILDKNLEQYFPKLIELVDRKLQ